MTPVSLPSPTLETVIDAALLAYDPFEQDLMRKMMDQGYNQITHEPALNAFCFASSDPTLPMIIAFRGTRSSTDIVDDVVLTVQKTVREERRLACKNFAETMLKKHPHHQQANIP